MSVKESMMIDRCKECMMVFKNRERLSQHLRDKHGGEKRRKKKNV